MKYDEEKLWVAVVEQAIREATGKNKELREAAYSWIHSEETFRTVCELANLDHERLKNMLSKIIGKKENFMDFSSQEKIKAFLIDNIKECVSYLLSDGKFHQGKFYMGSLGGDKIVIELKGENAGNWYDIYREKKGNILSLWALVEGNIDYTQSAEQWCAEKLQKQQSTIVKKTAFSVGQYLNDKSPMPKDIIGPRILTPGGLLVIGSTPKVGKSNFLLSLLAHMASGISFLNMKPPRPLKIFYLQNEMEYGDMKERLLQLKIDQNLWKENLFITNKMPLTLNSEEIRTVMAEKLDAKTVDLIVIDSFFDYREIISFIRNGMTFNN